MDKLLEEVDDAQATFYKAAERDVINRDNSLKYRLSIFFFLMYYGKYYGKGLCEKKLKKSEGDKNLY
jgi:hypothetical protein